MVTPGLFDELTWRGLIHQVTDPALARLLDEERVVAYVGFDPTADSLHLGHLMGILGLVRLQRAGHRVIALAGGGTGMVGDPSGRSEERQLLTNDVLTHNVAAIRSQLERFIDFSDAVLLDNRSWLGTVGLLEFLRDVGKHFTVNAMIAKESVRARLTEREQGISFTEFSYMLLQAYDFWQLNQREGCRLQLGGSDQWGNITAGIDLIRRLGGSTAYGLTWPLVTRADGTKFGKSEGGANVWLDAGRTSPYAMYQFLLRTEDSLVGVYLRAFTFRDRDETEALEAAPPETRAAQRALASDVVSLVHGADTAAAVAHASSVVFSEDIAELDEGLFVAVLSDVPSAELPAAGVPILDLLVSTGLERSRGAARRTVSQGGAYVNNRRVSTEDEILDPSQLLHGRYALLRKGKATQRLLVLPPATSTRTG